MEGLLRLVYRAGGFKWLLLSKLRTTNSKINEQETSPADALVRKVHSEVALDWARRVKQCITLRIYATFVWLYMGIIHGKYLITMQASDS